MTQSPLLLAVPNVSEGADAATIGAIGDAFAPANLLDVHSDPDHGRTVYSLAARQGALARALVAGAGVAFERIDMRAHAGSHPNVGAVDVMPVVYVREADRGAACAEALTAAAFVGDELSLPVFLYGELASGPDRIERADLRRGGLAALSTRVASGELIPDYGPAQVDPRSGAMLVTARPPLVAFNVELESADVELARAVARELRESGGGLVGVRAIGLLLASRGRAQVSVNVHDPLRTQLREIVELVRARAPIVECELVGLAPAAALEGFPDDVPLRGFDPERHVLENALRSIP